MMKLSRLLGVALISVLMLGGIAAGTMRAAAQTGTPPTPQVQACDVEDDDAAEPADAQAPDTDDIQEDVQCGQQDGPEDGAADADGVDEQSPLYAGSISVDESKFEGMTETEESAALAELASLSEEDAQAAALAANPGATVVKVELDNENGAVVYSVELSDGSDVKVDAGTGTVVHSEAAGQGED
jgi:uncharacterized membrane protein YkoI